MEEDVGRFGCVESCDGDGLVVGMACAGVGRGGVGGYDGSRLRRRSTWRVLRHSEVARGFGAQFTGADSSKGREEKKMKKRRRLLFG